MKNPFFTPTCRETSMVRKPSHPSHLTSHPTVHLHVTGVRLCAWRVSVKALNEALHMLNLGFSKSKRQVSSLPPSLSVSLSSGGRITMSSVWSILCNRSVGGSGAVRWLPLSYKCRPAQNRTFGFLFLFFNHSMLTLSWLVLISVGLNFKFGNHFLFVISQNHTKSHHIAFGFVSEHDASLISKYLHSESQTAVCMK